MNSCNNEAGNQPIGIVAPVPKDNWQATIMYYQLNIVKYGTMCLMAKQKNVGIEPTVTENWQEYWSVLIDFAPMIDKIDDLLIRLNSGEGA